jgi:hypothetical protein
MSILTMDVLLAAAMGISGGVVGCRGWAGLRRRQMNKLPDHGDLKLRPLFNELDQAAWLWLQHVFAEHKILIKVPLVRFLSGGTADFQSLVQIKGMYCTFTVCSSQGRVLGCIDVVGAKAIHESQRELKKKLFETFGLAYTVLTVDELPSPEAMRAVFLNEAMPLIPFVEDYDTSHSSLAFEFSTAQNLLDPVANVRHNLHTKLDTNRKLRPSGLAAYLA